MADAVVGAGGGLVGAGGAFVQGPRVVFAADNFNRFNGPLGANWSVIQGAININTNQARCGIVGDSAAMWVGVGTFDPVNYYSQVLSVAAVNFWGPGVCMSAGSLDNAAWGAVTGSLHD